MAHDIGDIVTLWAVFRNEAGAQTATTVTLIIEPPTGISVAGTVAPADGADEAAAEAATGETLSGVTGVYRSDVTITTAGTWWYRWAGSGAVTEVEEGWFDVPLRRVSAVPVP